MSARSENFPEIAVSARRIVLFGFLALSLGIGAAQLLDRDTGPQCLGELQGRRTFIVAEQPGIVASVLVSPGQIVKQGDPLFTLRDEALVTALTAQNNRITSLEAELARAQAQADLELQWRLRTLEAEICEIRLRSAGYLKEKFDFELQQTMLEDLLKEPKVAALDLPQPIFRDVLETPRLTEPQRVARQLQAVVAQNAAEVSAAQVEICDSREKELSRLKAELPQQIARTMGVDVARGQLERAQAELAQLAREQSKLEVVASGYGKVGLLRVKAGDRVVAGDEIVELLDDSQRELLVHVPSRAVPRFGLGTVVQLSFPGNVERTGRVASVSPQADRGEQIDGDPVVLVRVEQTGAVWPKGPAGSQVRVHPAR